MEKILALEILASLFAPFALNERDWVEEVDFIIQQRCSISSYELQPAYSLGQILLKPEFNPQTAAKAGEYFQQMKLSLQPNQPLVQADSKYSLAKELAYFLPRAYQDYPQNRDILRALRMISFHKGYLDDLIKTMKIDAQQIHDNGMIIETLRDAGDLNAANFITIRQIQLLNNQRTKYSKELSELHTILGTIHLLNKRVSQSRQQFEQAINLNTSNLKAHTGFINWSLISRGWEQLKEYISKYEAFFMGSNFLQAIQIICLHRFGNKDKSNEMFAKMEAQILANPVGQNQLPFYNMCCGVRYFKNSNFEKSIHHFQRELVLNKYGLYTLQFLPLATFRIGQYDASLYYCLIIQENILSARLLHKLLQIACNINLNRTITAIELLKKWEDRSYELPNIYLHFLMGIYNKLGQAEKAIALMNSIPKKIKNTNSIIQMQIVAMCSYIRLGNSKKADEMFHKTVELYQTYERKKLSIEQFLVLYYLIEYSFDHNLLMKGKILINSIHEYIEQMRAFNQKVAEDMQRQLIQRQRLEIEMRDPYF